MLTMTSYGDVVSSRREQLGLSRDELARAAELTASYIYRIEKGDVQTPSYQTVRQLSKALKLSIEELMGDYDPTPISISGDDWMVKFAREFAPNTPIEEVRIVVAYLNRLDATGRKAARAMLAGLSEHSDDDQERKAKG